METVPEYLGAETEHNSTPVGPTSEHSDPAHCLQGKASLPYKSVRDRPGHKGKYPPS